MKRRDFIKSMAAGSSMVMLGNFGLVQGKTFERPLFGDAQPGKFENIDHYHITHSIRDGIKFDIPKPTINKDVVIVGGGISGLTAASRLNDFDTLVLEKEPQLGGNSRRRSNKGIAYPLGAVTSQGKEGTFDDFFDELKVPFVRTKTPDLSLFIGGQLIVDPLGEGLAKLPFSQNVRTQVQKLVAQLKGFLDPVEGIFFQIEDNKPHIQKLDDIDLSTYLTGQNFGPQVRKLCDLIISSRLGAGSDKISAWMGLYILSRFNSPTYTLPGGHGLISELLTAQIDQQQNTNYLTETTTVKVQNKDDRVWTTAIDPQGEVFTVESKTAIMACPKLLSKLLISDLPEQQKQAMSGYKYSAYLVAQVALKRPVMNSFEIMTYDMFSRFILATDWIDENKSQDGNSHLTIYIPYPDVAGRINLYTAKPNDIAQRIFKDLQQIFPGIDNDVLGIELYRWGHPMVMPQPKMRERLEQVKQPHENIYFAHSDNMGISGLYSAVWAGMDAYTSAWVHLADDM